MIRFIKAKVVIFQKIHDEGWFQLNMLNYRSYVLQVYSEFKYYLKMDLILVYDESYKV